MSAPACLPVLALVATFAGWCEPESPPPQQGERLVATWRGHTGSVHAISVAADGNRAATASEDGTVRIWNVGTGVAEVVCQHGDRVWGVGFLPAGDRLVSGGFDGNLSLWNATDGTKLATIGPADTNRAIASLAISADGRRVLTGGFDARVRLWDLDTKAMTAEWSGHSDTVFAVAFGPGPDRVSSGSFDGTLRVVHVPSAACEAVLAEADPEQRGWKRAMVATEDGQKLLVAGAATPRLWDPASRSSLEFGGQHHTDSSVSITVAPGGLVAATGGFDGHVHLWDVTTRQCLARWNADQGDGVWAVAFLPDGRLLSAGNSGTVKLWDVPESRRRQR